MILRRSETFWSIGEALMLVVAIWSERGDVGGEGSGRHLLKMEGNGRSLGRDETLVLVIVIWNDRGGGEGWGGQYVLCECIDDVQIGEKREEDQ